MPKKKANVNSVVNDYCRNFIIEIYNEWENYNNILDFINLHYKNYLGIVHNKDIWVESDYKYKSDYMDSNGIKIGDSKKIHTHIVVLFANPRYRKTIANELGIDIKFIQKCKKNYLVNLQYLIHENNYDKFHYSLNDLFGTNSLKLKLQKSISDSEIQESRVIDIIRLIHSKKGYIKITDLTIDICNMGLYGTFRNSWSIIKEIVYEHNSNISNSNVNLNEIFLD